MHSGAALIALACLSACVGPTGPAPPPVFDPASEAFQAELRAQRGEALEKAAASTTIVTRRFLVMDEIHHGFFLISPDRLNERISPDFLDEGLLRLFIDQHHPEVVAARAGQHLVCECTGTDWMFYDQKRFIVRGAKLIWTD